MHNNILLSLVRESSGPALFVAGHRSRDLLKLIELKPVVGEDQTGFSPDDQNFRTEPAM